jgi:hypothetical protein
MERSALRRAVLVVAMVAPLGLPAACGEGGGPSDAESTSSPSSTADAAADANDAASDTGTSADVATDTSDAEDAEDVGSDAAASDASESDAAADPGPWGASIERCGNGVDDDDDGEIDEDCARSLWAGLFAPGGGQDLQTGHLVEAIENASGRAMPIVQTYRSTSALGLSRIEPDLALIFAHGAAAHLNIEPAGYTKGEYAAANTDPTIDADLKALGDALASALVLHPKGLVLFTFGAEMNGSWTDWGCLPAATFIGFYRKAHDDVTAALVAKGIDLRRVRWVYGPNNVSSCGSVIDYYPGHAYVDYLGMSAYRHGSESVQTTIVDPAHALLDGVGYKSAWKASRFIVLQTGTGASPDRGAWIGEVFTTLTADPAFLGSIYFSADNTLSKWSLVDSVMPLVSRPGYVEFVNAVATLPPNDARLAGTFEPYFWDVRQEHPQYREIQSLRASGITSGCAAAPPCFCPDAPLTRGEAVAFIARAFNITPAAASAVIAGVADPPTGAEVISALTALAAPTGDTCGASCETPVPRALGGAWVAHAAAIAPPPPL